MTDFTTKAQTTTATSEQQTSPTMLSSKQDTFQTDSTKSTNIHTIQTSATTEILSTEAQPKQHDMLHTFGTTFAN